MANSRLAMHPDLTSACSMNAQDTAGRTTTNLQTIDTSFRPVLSASEAVHDVLRPCHAIVWQHYVEHAKLEDILEILL